MSYIEEIPREKRRKNTGKVTLAEVAKRVGVSTMTVSRALRMPEKVTPDLRIKIEDAISALGYVPNLQARNLASAESNLIMVVLPSFSTPSFVPVSEALKTVMSENGYTLMYVEAEREGKRGYSTTQQILAYNPAAIINLNIDNTEDEVALLANSDIPVLDIGALNRHPTCFSVGVDYAVAIKKLVNAVSEAGYRNIGLICVSDNNLMFRQILSGWNTAMLALNYSPHRVVTTHDLSAGMTVGFNVLGDIRITWPELDALICTTDEIACGCIMACHSTGAHVPEDLAIASLGGNALASICSPTLTTVEFPWSEMGTLAAQTLLGILKGQEMTKTLELPATLKTRASTRKKIR